MGDFDAQLENDDDNGRIDGRIEGLTAPIEEELSELWNPSYKDDSRMSPDEYVSRSQEGVGALVNIPASLFTEW